MLLFSLFVRYMLITLLKKALDGITLKLLGVLRSRRDVAGMDECKAESPNTKLLDFDPSAKCRRILPTPTVFAQRPPERRKSQASVLRAHRIRSSFSAVISLNRSVQQRSNATRVIATIYRVLQESCGKE